MKRTNSVYPGHRVHEGAGSEAMNRILGGKRERSAVANGVPVASGRSPAEKRAERNEERREKHDSRSEERRER